LHRPPLVSLNWRRVVNFTGACNMGSENPEKNFGKIGLGQSEYETEKNYKELIEYLLDNKLFGLAKKIKEVKKINHEPRKK
jgi:hypothetical protein